MLRSLLAIIFGAVSWMGAFYAQVIALAALWPAFKAPARAWQNEFTFTFTTPMAIVMVLSWALAAIVAGWIAAKIARHKWAIWALAALIALYLASLHFLMFWSTFPWWYNLAVVIPAAPATLIGAWFARRELQ